MGVLQFYSTTQDIQVLLCPKNFGDDTERSIFLKNVLPDVYICFLRKNSEPPVPKGTVNVHLPA